tara:strand:+ start:202 stop:480 length:279 start_codon:yes stop_codon:yes gene_type:complete
MAFKMNKAGVSFGEGTGSALPKPDWKKVATEGLKHVFVPGYSGIKLAKYIKGKKNKKNEEADNYSKQKTKSKTTQETLEDKRKLDYNPQSQQ